MVAEQNGKTLRTASTVHISIKPDAAAVRAQLESRLLRRAVRPDARIAIEFTASDDLAIGSATFEYVVGSDDSKVARLPIPLDRAGSMRGGRPSRFRPPCPGTRR